MVKKVIMGWSVMAFVLVTLILISHQKRVDASMTCDEALTALTPCKPFLLEKAPKPDPTCCAGLKKVHASCSTPADVQAMCECFNKGREAWGFSPARAQQLPGACGMTALPCKSF